jgi:hypothetical protein
MSSDRFAELHSMVDRGIEVAHRRAMEGFKTSYQETDLDVLHARRESLMDAVKRAEAALLACARTLRFGEARELLSRVVELNAELTGLNEALNQKNQRSAA